MLKPEVTNEKICYCHQGVLEENGRVDTARKITDPSLLKVEPEDYINCAKPEIGDVEIWYYDIIDLENKYLIVAQFYIQTEALKNELSLYGTVFTHTTEDGVYNKIKRYHLNKLIVSQNTFNVKIEKNHLYWKYHPELKIYTYHLEANIEDITLELEFFPQIEGWKPLGDSVSFKDDNRTGSFSIISYIPKAKVNGTLAIKGKQYEIKNALGYHDHTVWKSRQQSEEFKSRLFIDDTIAKWEFAKFVASEYVVIFNILYLRPWLNQPPVKTLLVAKNNKIIHSSNNLIKTIHSHSEIDRNTMGKYPTQILVELLQNDIRINWDLKLKEIIDKQDLLAGINTVLKSLIRFIFGKPASYYMLMDSKINISVQNEELEDIKGIALYELLVLNNCPTRFEDYLRKLLHRKIK